LVDDEPEGKLIKIGAKVVGHGQLHRLPDGGSPYPEGLFADSLRLIVELGRRTGTKAKGEVRPNEGKIDIPGLEHTAVADLVPGRPNDDGPGLPMAAHSGNISPERRIIRGMSAKDQTANE
jgi:hypothetical protein